MVMTAEVQAFVETPINDHFGLEISEIAEEVKEYGRFKEWLNEDVTLITEVLEAVQNEGVSPAFFASYEVTEGYNSSWGWLNHTTKQGNDLQDAISVSQWIVSQSQNTTDNPAWIDVGNPVDFVPQSVKTEGNQHFSTLPAGTIGKVIIAGTAAATWGTYYPEGLLKEYNQVQDYANPITTMLNMITNWGGEGGGGETPIPDNELMNKISKDIYQIGDSDYFTNGTLTIMKQLDNTFKVRIKGGGVIPPTPDPTNKPAFPTTVGLEITSPYGWRFHPIHEEMRFHAAIDIGGGGVNHAIYATQSGEVILNQWSESAGWMLVIQHTGDHYYSRYIHLASQSPMVVGTIATKGQEIGTMGTTGDSTGIHLDFAISINGTFGTEADTIDPEQYLGN